METALELFWACGYESTSLSDLSAALGVGPSSLYNTFGSKEELYRECLDSYLEREGDLVRNPISSEDVLAGFCEMFVRAAERYTRPGLPRGCAIISAPISARPENASVEAHVRDLRATTLTLFEQAFERAKNQGELDPGAEPRALARYAFGMLQALSAQARDGADVEALRELALLAGAGLRRTGG